MSIRIISSKPLLGLTLLGALTLNTSAYAESAQAQRIETRLTAATKKIQEACGADAKKHCGTVTPGEGRLIYCMMAHEDQISSKCDYAVYDASRNLDRALDRLGQLADACWGDIEKNCSTVVDGEGRVAQCLAVKKASLSQACASTIDKFPVSAKR